MKRKQIRLGLCVVLALLTGFIWGASVDPGLSQAGGQLGEVTKTVRLLVDADGNGKPSPGDTLQYTIEIPNAGAGPLTGIVFTDTPERILGLVPGSVTASRGTVDTGNNPGDKRVVVSVPRIEANETITIQLSTRICVCATGVSQVANQGFVTGPEGTVPTDNPETPTAPGDATVTPLSPPAEPLLGEVSKAVSLQVDADGSGTPTAGDTLRYTIQIPNEGQVPLTGVVFTDPMGQGLRLVAGSVTTTTGTVVVGNSAGDERVTVTIPAIAPRARAVVTLDAVIAAGVQRVSNQALVDTPSGRVPTDNSETPRPNDETTTLVYPPLPPPSNPPVAQCEYQILTDRKVQFEDRSTDLDNDIVRWRWNFDDGTHSTERNPVHDYSGEVGMLFRVELTVTDAVGNTAYAICQVLLGDPPIPVVLDRNGNGRIDTEEFLIAIDYWVSGEEVPHTEQQEKRVVDDELLFQLIDLWLEERPIETVGKRASAMEQERGRDELQVRSRVGSSSEIYLVLDNPGISRMELEVFSLAGERLARGESGGRTLRLKLEDSSGRPLANGVYLYALTLQDLAGRVYRQVKTFAILR